MFAEAKEMRRLPSRLSPELDLSSGDWCHINSSVVDSDNREESYIRVPGQGNPETRVDA